MTRAPGAGPPSRLWRFGAASVLGASLLLCPRAGRAHDPITTRITFAREIRGILAARCAACHAPGGSAPMPLTTYEETRPWARAIKDQVLERRMPKWHAARGFGAFANDPTMTPHEQSMLVAWVDGGLPRGVDTREDARPATIARGAAGAVSAIVAAGHNHGASRTQPALWITGWSFEPGDPLITRAAIYSSAGPIGTWVAGDGAVRLPPGTALRAAGRIHVDLTRRAPADFEAPFTARPSVLKTIGTAQRPARRVWIDEAGCNARAVRPGTLLAVRPIMAAGAAARLWMLRPGAAPWILGWFRQFEPAYARAYWLARPVELSADTQLQADAPCDLQLTIASGH